MIKQLRFRSAPRRCLPVVLVLLVVLPLGCAVTPDDSGKAAILATSEADANFSGEYENTEYFQSHKPMPIAVLPFQDLERKVCLIDSDTDDPAGIVF